MTTKRRSKAALLAGESGRAAASGSAFREPRPCPECRGPTDADGRCAACRLVLPTPTGCEPWRTCPVHRTPTLAADGWCNPRRGEAPRPHGDPWHIAGPRLEREAGVYREREVPVLVPRAHLQGLIAAFTRALGRPAREPGEEPTEADLEARDARRAMLRAQAASRVAR